MLVHYNLYPSKSMRSKTIAVFYFMDCTPEDMISITRKMINKLDSSIGTVFYSDWSWEMDNGVTKMESYADIETLTEVCNGILEIIKE